jgi:hypothetical protein
MSIRLCITATLRTQDGSSITIDRDFPLVLSVPQAAVLLGKHRSTVHDDIARGRFPVPTAILSAPGASHVRIAAVPLARALGLPYQLVEDADEVP